VPLTVAALLAATPAAATPFSGEVEIDGDRGLYLECKGNGSPTVVLEAGLRSRGDYWSVKLEESQPVTVFDEIAQLTRVCEYDRPGTTLGTSEFSRSDPVPQPRTAADAVGDLRALLREGPIEAPVVLVGHSTGGLIVRMFASEYPRPVAGLVQIDALNEWIKPRMTAANWATFDSLNVVPPAGLEGYADLETIEFDRSFQQMRRIKRRAPLDEGLPYAVVSRGVPITYPPELGTEFALDAERAWSTGQDKLAGLLPSTLHLRAQRSGHYVMFDQPRIAIKAIRRVLFESVAE
jgi:pimeloyl-ACP methyl ester carboxylesterase